MFLHDSTARRRWPALLLAPALMLTLWAGCGKHHRSAMRPIYTAPAVVTPAAPCTTGDCGRGTPTVSPGFDDGGIQAIPAPSARPAAPRRSGPGGEPALEPLTPTSTGVPTLTVPRTSRRLDRRSASGAPRRTALRAAVEPFVNDPDDLFVPPKADRAWKYVVLHHSASPAGGYAQIDRDHRRIRGFDGCGYHFVIGNGTESPDGQVEVARRWSEQKGGAHCRDGKNPDVNEYGIGICLVGDLDHSPPTPRQVESARALVAYLQDRYAIPIDRIGTHAHVAAGPTACPGREFPTAAILADLASR